MSVQVGTALYDHNISRRVRVHPAGTMSHQTGGESDGNGSISSIFKKNQALSVIFCPIRANYFDCPYQYIRQMVENCCCGC